MKICFITDRYPTKEYPVNTFLDQLICQMAEQGDECVVIAPYRPLIDKLKGKKYSPPYYRERVTASGKIIKIYNPAYLWGTQKKIAGINMPQIGLNLFTAQVDKTIRKEKIEFDAVYGHFIYPAGFAAAKIGEKYNKPSFFAYGESSFNIVGRAFSDDNIRTKLESIAGVVSVSGKNRDELIEHGVVPAHKIRVFPNAIDNALFRVMNKDAAREKLGIKREDFVVAFVGHFINRKGSKRLSDALTGFEDVKSIFIGAGAEEPTCNHILFKGRVPHDQIPLYLNAADVFVLPTLAEGCCNAIVEAMACGLPIISSNLPFNDDILNENNSIRVNPENVEEIAAAIGELKNDAAKRERMATAALETASALTIDQRAKRIRTFMEELIDNDAHIE